MAGEVLWLQANPGDENLVAGTSARQDRQLIDVLLTEGVVDVAGGDLAASKHADEWKVTIAAGRCVITGDDQASQGKYLVTFPIDEDVALNPPPVSDKRIDVIYGKVNDPNAGGDAGYTAVLGFVEGATHASTPVAPAVPDSALILCSVLRESTDVTWADASITDLREATAVAVGDSGTSLASATAKVDTSESTTSTSMTNLTTPGPAVTITTGTKVLVIVSADIANGTADSNSYMGFAVSGASTVAADSTVALHNRGAANAPIGASYAKVLTGLTAGSNTFTAKYMVASGATTGIFTYRHISVIDLGS